MNTKTLREMYDYNYWANRLLLEMADNLTPEQFTAPSSHSFSSIQATLVHILDAESGWRNLLQGQPSDSPLDPADFPNVAALRQRWEEEEQAMYAYLDGLTDERLTKINQYEEEDGTLSQRILWHYLFHVVNHGMQHRSEVAHLLTSYSQSPGDLDFTRFLRER